MKDAPFFILLFTVENKIPALRKVLISNQSTKVYFIKFKRDLMEDPCWLKKSEITV